MSELLESLESAKNHFNSSVKDLIPNQYPPANAKLDIGALSLEASTERPKFRFTVDPERKSEELSDADRSEWVREAVNEHRATTLREHTSLGSGRPGVVQRHTREKHRRGGRGMDMR